MDNFLTDEEETCVNRDVILQKNAENGNKQMTLELRIRNFWDPKGGKELVKFDTHGAS